MRADRCTSGEDIGLGARIGESISRDIDRLTSSIANIDIFTERIISGRIREERRNHHTRKSMSREEYYE
jgi:hypothetical protein